MKRRINFFCKDQNKLAQSLKEKIGADAFFVQYYEYFAGESFTTFDLPSDVYGMEVQNILYVKSCQKYIPSSILVVQEGKRKRRIEVCISFWIEDGIDIDELQRIESYIRKEVKTNAEIMWHENVNSSKYYIVTVNFAKNPEKILG